MTRRVVTALILLAIVALGYVFEFLRWAPVLLIGGAGLLCVEELAAIYRPRGTHLFRRVAMLVVLGLGVLGWKQNLEASFLVLGLGMIVTMAIRLGKDPIEGAWRDCGATMGAMLYVGLPVGALIDLFVASPASRAWLLLTLTIVWTTDSLALFVGKRFGRAKIFPRLSPGKTWEGSTAGLIGALIPSIVALAFFPHFFGDVGSVHLIVFSICAGILTQVGDLVESMIKRDAGVKDSGSSLTGHGGWLDMLDAVLFLTLPLYAYLYLVQPQVL
ncbi:phosphatidate cytidylyltransferase [bacterium]|nr:phosphatidate cytidylyltransferase [bacterium]